MTTMRRDEPAASRIFWASWRLRQENTLGSARASGRGTKGTLPVASTQAPQVQVRPSTVVRLRAAGSRPVTSVPRNSSMFCSVNHCGLRSVNAVFSRTAGFPINSVSIGR